MVKQPHQGLSSNQAKEKGNSTNLYTSEMIDIFPAWGLGQIAVKRRQM